MQLAEIRNPNLETWLAEVDGRMVGFAQLRSGAAPEAVAGSVPLEIQRLYLHPEWLGSGIAHRLMTHLLERARSRNADTVWLGVWERNPRAIAFYRKFGFVEVATQVFTVGNDPQRDVVMARSLGESMQLTP